MFLENRPGYAAGVNVSMSETRARRAQKEPPMNLYEFEQLLKERKDLGSVNPKSEPGKSIAEEYRLAVCAAIKASGSRAALPKIWEDADRRAQKVLGEAKAREIAAPFKAQIEAAQAKVYARRKEIDAALDAAAPGLVGQIRRTNGCGTVLYFLYGGTYSSQGYGAYRYSHAHLKRVGEAAANQYGVRYEIAEAPGGWNVLVNVVGEADVEIMQRAKQPTTLREFVRQCWAQGVNPRVMNPYIPVGYEEREGLDYFGHDLRKMETGGVA